MEVKTVQETGIIFHVTRGSFHDGKGLRTVVFFKGCNLRCVWCQNPEGISMQPELMYLKHKCVGCGECLVRYPQCHKKQGDTILPDRERCTLCFGCPEICLSGALERCGTKINEEDLMSLIGKDKVFYRNSGGGVTFSGGECFLQYSFLTRMLTKCRSESIDTALETALCVPWEKIGGVLSLTNEFIVDIKHTDSKKHKFLTGRGNEIILNNIYKLSQEHDNVRIRFPLIPNKNDDADNMERTAAFINRCGSGIRTFEIMAYNDLYGYKYESLGLKDNGMREKKQSKDEIQKVRTYFAERLGKSIEIL